MQPKLIIVTGRPAAGKTTLSKKLADAIRCPLIARDAIKEGFVHTHHAHDVSVEADANRHVYDVFFDTIESLVEQKITLVAEAAFQHQLWQAKLEKLKTLADIRIIICQIDTILAQTRFEERNLADPERVNFHDAMMTAGDYVPPKFDLPTLLVDTIDAYQPSFDELVSFIRS